MSEADSDRRVVDGRFELRARLGGGGMGMVWRATDLVLHRSVAVKEVRPPDPGLAEYDPEAARMLRERVLREARALARIDHPNVVTIHHVVDGGEGSYPWIVMELVAGGSLADRLARGPMEPVEAARLGLEVLAALRAAHDAGIQHRDVKPANVLLRPDGRPVLTDFGIAAIRESTALTATGSVIGTPDYMAPERVSGQDGGPSSDLWSLAMMLYAAVEGHHPLRRATTLATLAAVLSEEVPPPTRAGALGDVLMRVLVRDPAARPDAPALERMLTDVVRGHAQGPAPAQPAGTSYHLAPPRAAPRPEPVTASDTPVAPGTPVAGTTVAPGAPVGAPGTRAAMPGTAAATPGAFGPAAAATPWNGPTPPGPPAPWTGPTPPVGLPVRRPGRRPRWVTVVLPAAGAVLAGVLVWTLLPGLGLEADSSSSGSDSDRTATSAPATTGATAAADPATGSPTGTGTTDLLTPDGIRTAIKAFEKETGRDRYGSFTVYPEFVSAYIMVKGSDTAYDSYTYRPGEGVKKGIIKGSLPSAWQPVTLDGFVWDRVPALLAEADRKLNVDDPDSRYLLVRQPSTTFDTPAGMAVYLSDEYNQSGYVEADTKGRVTRVMPADG
ncbi:serine/threonine-protein kinase [Streptomyces sp. NPDC052015]|uniref:serine/threonine-protein kinase n=1 Tax=Streptomyces sp. NPDC052015 TaxID=3154755 RepID=UPI00342AEB7F